jgi:glycosyltransferase involved in cell wall biosynthesis
MPDLKISTTIPVYAENIIQTEMLELALDSLLEQTKNPYEVVISDNSTDRNFITIIKNLCAKKELNIKYLQNTSFIGAANNTNFAVSLASGDLIHILYQDDFIVNKELYKEVSKKFNEKIDIWLIAQGQVEKRVLQSKFDAATKFGFNELGGPSALFVARKNYISFNPDYRMIFDVINYHEYFLKMGEPIIVKKQGGNIQFGLHEFQLSKKVKSKEVYSELRRFINDYSITSIEILTVVKSIKREIFHQRLLLLAGFMGKKVSFRFFLLYFSISIVKSLKRKVIN